MTVVSVNIQQTGAEDTLEIGSPMPDGTVYAGISPDTNRPIYAEPEDFAIKLTWDQATQYAAKTSVRGHARGAFRLPTKSELSIIFERRAALGKFGGGDHWSSTHLQGESLFTAHPEDCFYQRNFDPWYDDEQWSAKWTPRDRFAFVRLVRD